MTGHGSDDDRDPFTAELIARLTSPSNHASLSPAVRSVVTETLDPGSTSPSLSVPIALVRTTAATGGDDGSPSKGDEQSTSRGSTTDSAPDSDLASPPSRATLLEVCTSLAFLGGYATLRRDALDTAQTARDRDVAILASDYLHASAHATIARASVPTDRHVDLYRVLTAGSAALATSFLERNAAGTAQTERHERAAGTRSSPVAVLAGTGSALGAAVAGSSRETLGAMRTYGESLMAAIDAGSGEPSSGGERGEVGHEHEPDEPLLAAVERVLLGDREATGGDGSKTGDGDASRRPVSGPDSRPPAGTNAVDGDGDAHVRAHLERARSALDRLPETGPRERLEAATLVPWLAVEPGR